MLYDVPAPAKINLFLHVVGRRADGYHLLQTAFRFIGLSDTLHFDLRQDGGIGRAMPLAGVSEADDLTLRAARALQQATGTRAGVQITLEKRIPAGGGLGGGSSDAASVLIALNRLWNTGLARAELMRLALPLGADVPVFVFGRSAFGEGVGEALSEIDLPPAAYLVAQPDASVPTAEVFGAPDLTRDTECIKIADFLARLETGAGSAAGAGFGKDGFGGSGLVKDGFGKNDLEAVVFRRYPEILGARDWLNARLLSSSDLRAGQGNGARSNGARSIVHPVVRMSGSGACLFAAFGTFEQAVLAEQEIVATMRVSDQVYVSEDEMQVRFRLLQACPGLIEHPLRHWIAD